MDELTPLRNFRRETPGPSPAEVAAAWARLLDAIDDPQQAAAGASVPRRRRGLLGQLARPRLWAPLSAAAAVAALAAVAAVVAVPGSRTALPEPTRPAAAAVLDEAASAAARQTPGRGRFFVNVIEFAQPIVETPALQGSWYGDGEPGWLAQYGYFDHGSGLSVGDAELTAAQQKDLPTAPRRLLAYIAKVSEWPGVASSAELDFTTIANTLAQTPWPPALRSALYRAAALLPGMTVVRHAHDLLGRPATEVFPHGGNTTALFFDPATGTVLGVRSAYPGGGNECSSPDTQYAVLFSGYVSAKQLPPGVPRKPEPLARPSATPKCPAH